MSRNRWALAFVALALVGSQQAASSSMDVARTVEADIPFHPYREVYFGDLHLHTSFSLDAAGEFGITTMPDDAYRFALGEAVEYQGREVRRHAPLDFLAVTDHAEFLGTVRMEREGLLSLPDYVREMLIGDPDDVYAKPHMLGLQGVDVPGYSNPALINSNWHEIIASAERFNQPGKFTTFVGFEYSPGFSEPLASLHRNVIFRGPTYPAMPFAATDSLHPEALWAYAEENRARGADSLMIPHNSNLSAGLNFSYLDSYGNPINAAYARLRARNEPLVEITQKKGTSETMPSLSPDDEFAGFEVVSPNNPDPEGSYVRSGLLRGMEMAESTGVNPFEQGFVGASDFHSGISASEENNFPGGLGSLDDQRDPEMVLQGFNAVAGGPIGNYVGASGITGVWAESNTRESIFDAMRRREVYATSGPRMRVRVFGGWSAPGDMLDKADWVRRAYQWGVPMGANLPSRPASAHVPNLVFQAVRDPFSGNLDRVQVIKLWRENGRSYERIFDVAWSAGRSIDARTGKLEPVGNTVDAASASYTNTIGSAELAGSWSDPDFDPAEQALYYVRVLEIPTPRWTTYLAAQTGFTLDDSTPRWIQERAWTSPIYYKP